MKFEHRLNEAQAKYARAALEKVQADNTAALVALGVAREHEVKKAAHVAALEETLKLIVEVERLPPGLVLSQDGTMLVGEVADVPQDAALPPVPAPPGAPHFVNGVAAHV